MKKSIFVILACLGSTSLGHAQTKAIINARAITVADNEVIDSATIIIRDGEIEAVGADIIAPENAEIIDAGGRYVSPGFMNGATQLGLTEVNSISGTVDHSASGGDLGVAFDVSYALNSNSTLISLARTDGLVRAMTIPGGGAAAPFDGMGAAITLRQSDDILERRCLAVFAKVGGASSSVVGGSRAAQWQSLRMALDAAASNEKADATPENECSNPLKKVLSGERPLAIHTSRESDIRQSVKLVDDYGIRVNIIGGAEAWRVADEIAQRNIGVVLDAYGGQPNTFDEFGARSDNAAILAAAGVKIAFMATSIHYSHDAGSGIRDAAGFAAAFGLSWENAIRALTINPSAIWGLEDQYGMIAPGQSADLVIWSGDPIEPLSMAERMLIEGEEISLTSRQDLLTRRYFPKNEILRPAYRR
ncbi:amidohydrolase family protein [Hyphococcus sp. DH-69]|uniref:amidohydrolase family protein n=1 Tax=Hyphococcus formosus TaxID=3143534 RepID=UPI00398B1E2F